jgi:hypothetical protein
MAVSGKTASPHEVPYFLDSDKPPNMATVTKAMADRLHARLNAVDLSQLVVPGSSDGKLVIVKDGVAAYKAMSGDGTIDEDGNFQLGSKVVGTSELADKGVTDPKLASPNSGVYRHLLQVSSGGNFNSGAGTVYVLGYKELVASGGSFFNAAVIPFNNDNYEVAGKTQKLRLVVAIATNGTKPASKFTFSLRSLASSGGAGAFALTAGEAVAGSSVEINEPAANQITRAEGTDFAVPADGSYGICVSTSASITVVAMFIAALQVRNI